MLEAILYPVFHWEFFRSGTARSPCARGISLGDIGHGSEAFLTTCTCQPHTCLTRDCYFRSWTGQFNIRDFKGSSWLYRPMRHPPMWLRLSTPTPSLRTGVSDWTPSASGSTFTFTAVIIHPCLLCGTFSHVDVKILP